MVKVVSFCLPAALAACGTSLSFSSFSITLVVFCTFLSACCKQQMGLASLYNSKSYPVYDWYAFFDDDTYLRKECKIYFTYNSL